MKEQYEITDAELEIMQVLWKNRECNLTTITQELSRNENKNKNTIKTLIHRLIQKGAIESQKINNKFIKKESNSFLEKFFNGNTEKLLLNFVEEKKITKEELKKLIDTLEQDEM